MKKIFKYPLEIRNRQQVSMPFGAEILTVQVQNGDVYIWALVNPTNSPEDITICVVGTGFEVPENTAYIASVQQGRFVWHVFKEI